jgi:AraC-like DNA-binding protein
LFQINSIYQDPKAIVKRSRVSRAATFAGVTKGVAIKYVGQGQERYTVGEDRLLLDAGEFLLLPAGTAYQAKSGAVNQANTGVCIDFLAGLPEESSFDFLYGGTFRVANLGLARLANWDKLSNQLAAKQIPTIQQEIKDFLEDAIGLGSALLPVASQATTRRELSKSMLTARNHLRRYYSDQLPLGELSRIAGLSKFHFSRLFKRAFGITPLRMQTTLRMQAAANLIGRNQSSLTTIAHTVGYTDLATFSRHFRTHYGVPPSKWG